MAVVSVCRHRSCSKDRKGNNTAFVAVRTNNKNHNRNKAHPGQNDQYNPYGTGTTSSSPMIALGEGWAYFIGHYLADQHYDINSSCQTEQKGGTTYCNSGGTGHPHIDVIENFDPNLGTDPFNWIPKGLMLDLIDNGENFTLTHVNDQVSGYTIAQIFTAMQSDISSVPQFKTRLVAQNPGNQTNVYMDNLFTSYHY